MNSIIPSQCGAIWSLKRKDDSPLCIYQYHLSVAAPDSTAQNVGFKNLLVQKLYFSIAFLRDFVMNHWLEPLLNFSRNKNLHIIDNIPSRGWPAAVCVGGGGWGGESGLQCWVVGCLFVRVWKKSAPAPTSLAAREILASAAATRLKCWRLVSIIVLCKFLWKCSVLWR